MLALVHRYGMTRSEVQLKPDSIEALKAELPAMMDKILTTPGLRGAVIVFEGDDKMVSYVPTALPP